MPRLKTKKTKELCICAVRLSFSSSKVSNGETESVKTMIVHDEAESDTAITPSKDGTLIVRQVREDDFLSLSNVLHVLCFSSFIRSFCMYLK